MSEFDFILDSIRYSFSSVNTYCTCPYCFRLTYLDCKSKTQNFYAEFGLLVHDILHQFFDQQIEIYQLTEEFEKNFDKFCQSPPPPYPAGMRDKYYQDGLDFFNEFSFDREKYEVVMNEGEIRTKLGEIELVVKPDLVIRDKETGETSLIDYKTSKIRGNSKKDLAKIDQYTKQTLLYKYFVEKELNIKIDNVKIWFVRDGPEKFSYIYFNEETTRDALKWFYLTIRDKIMKDNEWKAKPDSYFCSWLCGTASHCEYR